MFKYTVREMKMNHPMYTSPVKTLTGITNTGAALFATVHRLA